MGRSVAAGQSITYGSDGTIDGYALKSALAHSASSPAAAGNFLPLHKLSWLFEIARNAIGETNAHLRFFQDFTTTDGDWSTPNDSITLGANTAIAVTYDLGATGNDPNIYINGTLQAEVALLPRIGTAVADSANDLTAAAGSAGGTVGWVVYDNIIMTAADVNRHRWWGVAPGGPSTISVWHPMWTSDNSNKGTATANVQTDSSSFVAVPRVERMYASMMGCGR